MNTSNIITWSTNSARIVESYDPSRTYDAGTPTHTYCHLDVNMDENIIAYSICHLQYNYRNHVGDTTQYICDDDQEFLIECFEDGLRCVDRLTTAEIEEGSDKLYTFAGDHDRVKL
jgi:hypothetical protein